MQNDFVERDPNEYEKFWKWYQAADCLEMEMLSLTGKSNLNKLLNDHNLYSKLVELTEAATETFKSEGKLKEYGLEFGLFYTDISEHKPKRRRYYE